MKKLRIGNLELDSPLISAPLAGVSDIAFRSLCRSNGKGAGLTYSEMINANALMRKNKATISMARKDKDNLDYPIAMQLFGTRLDCIEFSAKFLERECNADIIDFNFGCPASDIVRQGAGSALLKRPKKIFDIVKCIKDAVSIPVTAKIRLGINNQSKNYLQVSKLIEEAGADAIIVHGRTATMGYTGTADWEAIKEIKNNVSIPVVGNGDIITGEKAKYYLENEYCDGIMIGRGAMGNTSVFTDINEFLSGKEWHESNSLEKYEALQRYIEIAEKNDDLVFARLKMHAQFFTKGMRGAAKIRNTLSQAKDIESLKLMISECWDSK